jgi:hypothetical protein
VLLLFELILQPWSYRITRFDMKPISADSRDAPISTVHYFDEGVATSHFTPSRARMTGNPIIGDAPWVVILGDSFVEALQVNDRETMGSQLERLARRYRQPLNVRQYGWSGDAPPHYAVLASQVIHKWHPKMVVVVTNVGDYTQSALNTSFAEMHIQNGRATVIEKPAPPRSSFRFSVWQIGNRSALFEHLAIRFVLDILPTFHSPLPADSQNMSPHSSEEQMNATLRILKEAYGKRLFLLYTAQPGLGGTADPDEAILNECTAQGVRCASTRAMWIREKDAGTLASGFSNSAPGAGHYNRAGDSIIARLIWEEIQQRAAKGHW